MKIEELVHRVAGEALSLLERRYHYRISEDHKKDIQNERKCFAMGIQECK